MGTLNGWIGIHTLNALENSTTGYVLHLRDFCRAEDCGWGRTRGAVRPRGMWKWLIYITCSFPAISCQPSRKPDHFLSKGGGFGTTPPAEARNSSERCTFVYMFGRYVIILKKEGSAKACLCSWCKFAAPARLSPDHLPSRK